MSADPDYSAAAIVLETDNPSGVEGHGLTFTTGRGTELCVAAAELLAVQVVGRTIEDIASDMSGFWRGLVGDSQMRWLGPEKGVVHLATAALVNAVWDLYAKVEGKPLWKLLSDMSADELVACVDFRYIDDVLAPDEALEILRLKRGHATGPRGGDAARRLPGVHHLCRVDWVLGREGPGASRGGDGGGIHTAEDEGWPRPGF